jgi:DNA polymerase-2
VEYFWTINGPEPASLPHGPYDYDHYADTQVLSVARSIAGAVGWNLEPYLGKSRAWRVPEAGQMELDLQI